jgi:PilZ domain
MAIELRRAKRYRVSAPASFWWEQPDGILQAGKGTTRDVSSFGVAIVADTAPSPGSHLQVEVHFPETEVAGKTAHLQGEGRVVRIERKRDLIQGFAAEVTFQTTPTNQDPLPDLGIRH